MTSSYKLPTPRNEETWVLLNLQGGLTLSPSVSLSHPHRLFPKSACVCINFLSLISLTCKQKQIPLTFSVERTILLAAYTMLCGHFVPHLVVSTHSGPGVWNSSISCNSIFSLKSNALSHKKRGQHILLKRLCCKRLCSSKHADLKGKTWLSCMKVKLAWNSLIVLHWNLYTHSIVLDFWVGECLKVLLTFLIDSFFLLEASFL